MKLGVIMKETLCTETKKERLYKEQERVFSIKQQMKQITTAAKAIFVKN